MQKYQISSIIARVIRENNEQLNELRTALDDTYRKKSLLSGNERRNRIGRENAAFNPPPEKSHGKLPRNIKPDEARKRNVKVTFSEPDPSQLAIIDPMADKKKKMMNESYEFMIEKPTGYGTFMTAKDLGIKMQSAFEHHPTVSKELYRRRTRRKRKYNNGE